MKKRCRRLVAVLILLALAVSFLLWGNRSIVTSEYNISATSLPSAFDGLRIVQVSDLHNNRFGKGNRRLLAKITEAAPDLIFLTGDLLDSRRTDPQTVVDFAREVIKIAPVYYIVGNHESRIPADFLPVEAKLKEMGICVLRNRSVSLEREGQQLQIAGIDDPEFFTDREAFLQTLNSLCDDEGYTLLLSHHPELLAHYAEAGAELVFSGHAHGGQVRLPWIGGLFAPHQGSFPAYDAGLFTEDATSMIVSRGLGNSLFPLRIFNRPELVVAELKTIP